MTTPLKIATRGSKLALWQAHFVKDQLTAQGHDIHIEAISTKGDRVQDRFLHEIGGKGLFIRELEASLAAGDTHFAVHSLKDLPAKLPQPFQLAAVLPRHVSHDVLVLNPNKHDAKAFAATPELTASSAKELLKGFTIGTSSLRRRSLLTGLNAQIDTIAVRGNVDTRIAKLKASELDGLILAGASLKRLGINDVLALPFSEEWFVPCAGQGALAIEAVATEAGATEAGASPGANLSQEDITRTTAALKPLNDPLTFFCVAVEREVLHLLGGDCTMPAGIKVTPSEGNSFQIHAVVLDYEGNEARTQLQRPYDPAREGAFEPNEAAEIAQQIFDALQAAGAKTIIERLSQTAPPQFPLL